MKNKQRIVCDHLTFVYDSTSIKSPLMLFNVNVLLIFIISVNISIFNTYHSPGKNVPIPTEKNFFQYSSYISRYTCRNLSMQHYFDENMCHNFCTLFGNLQKLPEFANICLEHVTFVNAVYHSKTRKNIR
jgi:hypothetical protein